jgi:hypothetical protein
MFFFYIKILVPYYFIFNFFNFLLYKLQENIVLFQYGIENFEFQKNMSMNECLGLPYI